MSPPSSKLIHMLSDLILGFDEFVSLVAFHSIRNMSFQTCTLSFELGVFVGGFPVLAAILPLIPTGSVLAIDVIAVSVTSHLILFLISFSQILNSSH